jgi:hypothetical protein
MQIYLHDSVEAFTLQIQGTVRQDDVAKLEGCWRTAESIIKGKAFSIDVSDLVFADESARDLLVRMRISGARIRSVSASARDFLGEIVDEAPASRARGHLLRRIWRSLKVISGLHTSRCWPATNLPGGRE